MIGIPKILNTKQDVLYCVELAKQNEVDKAELKVKLQNLLSDEKVWVFKAEVDASYTPAASEKVMEQKEMETGSIKYVCYELIDNPNARFLQMGLTKNEILHLISELED